jgi:hypothetical protein
MNSFLIINLRLGLIFVATWSLVYLDGLGEMDRCLLVF